MHSIKIGIIQELKNPPDSRVPLNPQQCRFLLDKYPQLEIYVAPSPARCYADAEYEALNIPLKADLSDCDYLMGVKEVPIDALISNKNYLFFSHTHKGQVYNRPLLKAFIDKNIRMIDYECLVDETGQRIIGFGRFAGIVGAHNGLLEYGNRTKAYQLKAAHQTKDYATLKASYQNIQFPPFKIILTGNGRVGKGAKELLDAVGIREVSANDFLNQTFTEVVYTHLDIDQLYVRKDQQPFDREDFYTHPEKYESAFAPYTKVSDLMINGIFWREKNPVYFSQKDMQSPDFKIKSIADVTCDIAPVASIPATLKATKIGDPVFGYDPITGQETAPYLDHVIDIMSIDNLPNELPRDAADMFGAVLSEKVIPAFFEESSPILDRSTLTQNGQHAKNFAYMKDFLVDLAPS